jgi:hypothetical protein
MIFFYYYLKKTNKILYQKTKHMVDAIPIYSIFSLVEITRSILCDRLTSIFFYIHICSGHQQTSLGRNL